MTASIGQEMPFLEVQNLTLVEAIAIIVRK